MGNKDNEEMIEEIADEAMIEEITDEAMIEEIADEAMIEEIADEALIEERVLQPHTVSIKPSQYGRLVSNPPKAVAGEVITVSCTTNEPQKYKLKGINVLTSNGILRLGNKRGFKMPNCDVTLEAVFEEKKIALTPVVEPAIKCPYCNTYYYKSYSKYCHHCGKKRT